MAIKVAQNGTDVEPKPEVENLVIASAKNEPKGDDLISFDREKAEADKKSEIEMQSNNVAVMVSESQGDNHLTEEDDVIVLAMGQSFESKQAKTPGIICMADISLIYGVLTHAVLILHCAFL